MKEGGTIHDTETIEIRSRHISPTGYHSLYARGRNFRHSVRRAGNHTFCPKSHIITRAGDEVKQFKEDTKYLLYANRGNEWPLYNREGTEQANHTIGYGSPLVYDDTPISIYGVTYGTAASSPSKAPENTPLDNPVIKEAVTEDNSLPDLMFSNNLKDQTVSNGYRLEMDFKHAMSKVEFMIVKQDESGDAKKKLENVTLKI